MANHLKMATVNAILTLRQRGWSFRRIARELGIHRDTVSRHVRLTENASSQGVRELMGLLSLSKRHPDDAIETACQRASTHGAYRLRIIRELIKRQAPKQEQFEFIDTYPIIRSLSEYGEWVRTAFTKESAHCGVIVACRCRSIQLRTDDRWGVGVGQRR